MEVEFQMYLPVTIEHLSQIVIVLLHVLTRHNNVINVMMVSECSPSGYTYTYLLLVLLGTGCHRGHPVGGLRDRSNNPQSFHPVELCLNSVSHGNQDPMSRADHGSQIRIYNHRLHDRQLAKFVNEKIIVIRKDTLCRIGDQCKLMHGLEMKMKPVPCLSRHLYQGEIRLCL